MRKKAVSSKKPLKQNPVKPLQDLPPLILEPWEEVPEKQGLSGHFRQHQHFPSAHLRHGRNILIWLPPSYDTSTQHYPVLYMHDGNNLFDPATSYIGVEWQVDEHMQRLVAEKKVEEIIVVGIYNTPGREDEYTWTPMLQDDGVVRGGQGPRYARFITEELKPFIDAMYRTRSDRDHTAVAGSSLGGLISFYLGLYASHVFSKIGIISPSLWWNNGEPIKDAAHMPLDLNIWVDMGTEEGGDGRSAVERVVAFAEALQERGYVLGENLAFVLDEGAKHNESAWAGRVDEMILYFFGLPDPAADAEFETEYETETEYKTETDYQEFDTEADQDANADSDPDSD